MVGDKKSSPISSTDRLIFLSIEDQMKLKYKFIEYCPLNHYARKNIGYLYAIQNGADIIYDTDDDNYPNADWFLPHFFCQILSLIRRHSYLWTGLDSLYLQLQLHFF